MLSNMKFNKDLQYITSLIRYIYSTSNSTKPPIIANNNYKMYSLGWVEIYLHKIDKSIKIFVSKI